MPNLKDKPRQSAPVPGNYLIMVVNPTTGETRGIPVSEFMSANIIPDTTPPSIVTAVTQSATVIRVTFSEAVTAGSIAGWSAKRNGVNNPILSVSGIGTAVLDFVVQTNMVGGDVILLSYDPTTGATTDAAANEVATITDQNVNNTLGGGGGGDVTAPTVVSAVVNNANPNQVVVTFSESVNATTAGWSFRRAGVNWVINSLAGSGTVWTFTMATNAANGETLDRSYNPGTGNTLDLAGNELGSFTNASVTNNVAGGPTITYLTFTPLDSDFEAYNSNQGYRLAAGVGDNIWNLQWANQTLSTGQRLVVRIDNNAMRFMAGVHLNNTATAYGDTFSAIRLIGDGTIGWHNPNGGSYNRGPETVDRTYYAIFKDGSDSYTFQKSNDLVAWTSIGASIPGWSFGNPVPVFITSDGVDLDGYLEIFILG